VTLATGRALPVLLLAISIVTSAIDPAIARVGGALIDAIQRATRGGGTRAVVALVALEAALSIAATLAAMASGEVMTRLREHLDFDLTRRVLQKAQTLTLAQLDAPTMRDKIARARSGGYCVANTFRTVMSLLQATLSLAAYLTAGRSISRGWIALFGCTAVLRFAIGVREAASRHGRERQRTERRRESAYVESVLTDAAHAPEVKVLGIGPLLVERWGQLLRSVRQERRGDVARDAAFTGGGSVLETCALYALYGTFAVAAARGGMSLGELTFSMVALRGTKGAIGSLLSACHSLYEDHLSLDELWELLELDGEEPSGTARDGMCPGDGVRFEGVSFTYPGAARASLTDVTAHFPPGERVVVLGANGSGKSTFLALLCGLHRPTSGRVLLDGRDLREWERDALRRRLAILFQTFGRYEVTARESIALGDLSRASTPEDVAEAAGAGLADEVVRDLSDGYETRLGRSFAGSRQLSGGQWQRMALARWFFRRAADVLVLDEPTAAMDLEAETHVVDALGAFGKDRTLVVASHRREVLRIATRVVVLERGRIVEDGTPVAVTGRGGHGAKLLRIEEWARGAA
jgi:ATP-binding cassette subfamily B protein